MSRVLDAAERDVQAKLLAAGRRVRGEPMRFAYADPPYPGQSARHYADHPDYAGEVDHRALLRLLKNGYVRSLSEIA